MTDEEIDKMEAGPKIDLLIAEIMKYPIIDITPPCDHNIIPYMTHIAVFSPTEIHYHRALGNDGKNYSWGIWNPSKDIARVWEVVEKLLGQKSFSLDFIYPKWTAQFADIGSGWDANLISDSVAAPLAISRAILKAVNNG